MVGYLEFHFQRGSFRNRMRKTTFVGRCESKKATHWNNCVINHLNYSVCCFCGSIAMICAYLQTRLRFVTLSPSQSTVTHSLFDSVMGRDFGSDLRGAASREERTVANDIATISGWMMIPETTTPTNDGCHPFILFGLFQLFTLEKLIVSHY